MDYTFFDTDGKPMGHIGCSPDEIALNVTLNNGSDYRPGMLPLASIALFDGEVVTLPESTGEGFKFNYETRQWVADPDGAWATVRSRRDGLLVGCDWTQLPDIPTSIRQAWAIYRQSLRDITLQPDPFNLVWPSKP